MNIRACRELCLQPVAQKPDTLTHCQRKMVAKAIASGFRAVLDSTIALGVQVNWRNRGSVAGGYPFASWQHYACRCAGRPLGCQAIVGLSDEDLHRLSHQPRVISTTIIWCGSQPRARCGVLNLLRQSGSRNRSGASLYHLQLK